LSHLKVGHERKVGRETPLFFNGVSHVSHLSHVFARTYAREGEKRRFQIPTVVSFLVGQVGQVGQLIELKEFFASHVGF